LGIRNESVDDSGSRRCVHFLRYSPDMLVDRGRGLAQFASELVVFRQAAEHESGYLLLHRREPILAAKEIELAFRYEQDFTPCKHLEQYSLFAERVCFL
jgi:hypothetical protein